MVDKAVNYYFKIAGGMTLCFQTAHNLSRDKEAILQLAAYTPAIEMMSDIPSHVDLKIEHLIGEESDFKYDGHRLIITSPDASEIPQDVYHLLYGAVRKKLLEEKRLCSVHAACVGLGNDFRLVVGHSGAGKTTLVQRLVENHNMTMFSGNKTVVEFKNGNALTAVAGTKTMTALDANLKRYAYEVDRAQYASQSEVPIRRIDIVRVNDGVEECEELSPLSALHTLYPYFLDQVNADIIISGNKFFDGGISSGVREVIIIKMQETLKTVPVRKISGSMQYLEKMTQMNQAPS